VGASIRVLPVSGLPVSGLQGGDPLNRQFNQIEIEAIEVRASIQRQSTEDVVNVNSIHVNAELTLKYVDG